MALLGLYKVLSFRVNVSKMASSIDRIVLSNDRVTVQKLRDVGRKLSKNLASSVDKLLEILDVMYFLPFFHFFINY